MQRFIRENTDAWRIDVIGGGIAYAVTRKTDGAEFFVQGDDAAQFRETLYGVELSHTDWGSRFFGLTWNQCLAYVCEPYLV